MVLMESEKGNLDTPAHNFHLKGTDGEMYSLSSFVEAKVLVVVFMCNHCPYVQRIWGELVGLQEKYEDLEVQFVGINPNVGAEGYDEETFAKMKDHYQKFQMNFPYLVDDTQEVAREYNAQCTPDIYVYDSKRLLKYHGRVEEMELERAILALIDRKDPLQDQNSSIGCSIKWKE